MKTLLFLLLVPVFAFAQNAVIGYPPDGHTVSPGNNLTVQIQRPNTLTSSEEVAVVIGLQTCATSGGACASPEYMMGQILYNGPFDPQYHGPTTPPYENFTVQIPSSVGKGPAKIGVIHLTLISAGPFPMMEALNKSIAVV
ncbi:hypothetical protein EDC04DRAFT_2866349 [Pisolithus marmoratus]|nr:hypothetical protein EDC04DRAFT_2866349 [Pisolithus marmoratus]